MGRLFRSLDRITEALAFCGMVCLSAAIAASMIDIVGRKTTGFTILGIMDITQLLVMSCICLAFPLAFVREGHVGVQVITDRLPPRGLAALELVVSAVGFIFGRRSPATRWPRRSSRSSAATRR
jgi:TRAP-type C4-dicarboxylate transport system permease small subunit